MIKTSIIVTVYNEEKNIERLLKSFSVQSVTPNEIIIVDGGSSDKTVRIIKNFISQNKNINLKVFIMKGNRSIGRNEAIKQSKNELIAISDAGCMLDKNWLKYITAPFESKDVDVVAGYYKAKTTTTFEKSIVPYVFVMPDQINPHQFLPATRSMAIRKSIWKKVGGFDNKLSNNEDYAFANKLKKMGANMKFTDKAIVYWFPRTNIIQAFNMFYRFAEGDAESGIYRPKVGLIFLRYFVVLYLLMIGSFEIVSVLLLVYIFWSVFKNYKYVKVAEGIIYLPIIQITADLAVMSGTIKGMI